MSDEQRDRTYRKLFLFTARLGFSANNGRICLTEEHRTATPSYVSSDIECLIGDAATDQIAMNPHNTVFDAKRLIGRKFADPEVQSDMKHFSYKVVDKGGKPSCSVEYRGETKEFVSSIW